MRLGETPILLPNSELLRHFESYARDLLAWIEGEKEESRAAAKIILARLDDTALSIGKVAKEMSVSVRTLQNRMEKEGTVFSELLREIRETLAKKRLRENFSVEDIAYMLGFAEPSSFRKAFKRWTGLTPREFRESEQSHTPTEEATAGAYGASQATHASGE